MVYSEEDSEKLYVVHRRSGHGVVEAPFVTHEAVFETNELEDANKKVSELTIKNNTHQEIESTWIPNTYEVHLNIGLDEGKKIIDKNTKEARDRAGYLDNSKYYTTVHNGITFHIKKWLK